MQHNGPTGTHKGFRVKAPQFVQQIPVLILLLSAYQTLTRMSGWQKSQRMWVMREAAWCSSSHWLFCNPPQQGDNASERVTSPQHRCCLIPLITQHTRTLKRPIRKRSHHHYKTRIVLLIQSGLTCSFYRAWNRHHKQQRLSNKSNQRTDFLLIGLQTTVIMSRQQHEYVCYWVTSGSHAESHRINLILLCIIGD